jgi:integrase
MAWIEKRKRRHHTAYRVYWREPSGRVRVKTFTRAADAERWARRVEAAKDDGTYIPPEAGRIPLGRYIDELLEGLDVRPSTKAWYRAHRKLLPEAFAARSLVQVRPGDVRELLDDLRREHGPASVDAVRQLLHRTFAQAVAEERVPRNPVSPVRVAKPRRRDPRFLTAAEVGAIVEAIPDRYRALVLVLAYGGLRIGEALGLRVGDVDPLRSRVLVRGQLAEIGGRQVRAPTKTGRERAVHVPRFVMEALAPHLVGPGGSPREPEEPLFTTEAGAPVRASNFRCREWRAAVRAVGLHPEPTLHDLRHTAAALAISAGAHPKEIADMLGHSTVRVTLDVYGGLLPGLHERLAARLEELGRPSAPEGAVHALHVADGDEHPAAEPSG